VRGCALGRLAGIAGVTVRALHHHDAIGLLKVTARSERGYRLSMGTTVCSIRSRSCSIERWACRSVRFTAP
jgi:hypothetical protein